MKTIWPSDFKIWTCTFMALFGTFHPITQAQIESPPQEANNTTPLFQKVGSWPGHPRGPAMDVALLDQYAYVAIGFGGILILDVSNPAIPKRMGYVNDVGYASLLKIHNDRLYVASKFHRGNRYGKEGYRGELLILNLIDPTRPSLMGSQIFGTEIQSFDVQGNRILIGEGNHAWGHTESSLRLLDVIEPADIKTIDVLQLRNNQLNNFLSSPGMVAIEQDRTYVSGFQANFGWVRTHQITASGKQSRLNTFVPDKNGLWPVHHVQVQDKLLYIAGRSLKTHKNVLDIWDLTDVDSPRKKGTVDILDSFTRLRDFAETEIGDGKAVLCMKQYGIQVIQVDDPTRPTLIGHVDTPGTAMRAEMKDGLIYIADFEGGLQIVKFTDSNSIQTVGYFDTGLTPKNFVIAGDRGFLLNQSKEQFLPNRPSYKWSIPGNVECIDLSNPTQPALLGKIDLPRSVDFFTATESRLFVGWNSKMQMFDITDPKSPVMLVEKVITTEGYEPTAVEIIATDTPPRLYVSEKAIRRSIPANLTTIFDTSNPTQFKKIDSFTRGGAVQNGMILHSNRLFQNAFASSSLDILLVFNHHARNEFSFVGSHALPSREWSLLGRKRGGLDAEGDYLFAGLSWNGFSIVDMEQPDNPKHLFHQTTEGEVQDVAVTNRHLYVAEGWEGLSVYDVSDPSLTHQVANLPTHGPATNIEVLNKHVFVVSQGNGLDVFKMAPETLTITTQPKPVRTKKGNPITLNVGAIGPGALTYQWFHGERGDTSRAIRDAKAPSFRTAPVEQVEHYWVRVNDGTNQFESETVRISPAPEVSVELIGRWPDTTEPIDRQGFSYDMAIRSDLVYLADGTGGIQIIHVADPKTPVKMANYPVWARQIKIQGNDLFLNSTVFKIFSIQNPYEPREIYKSVYDDLATLPMGPWTFLSTTSGFFTLDRRNPMRTPTLLTSRLISPVSEWHAKDMDISGNIVGVSQNWGGIQLMNVTHPDEPTFLSAYYPNASINQIAWQDSTIVATHGELFPGLETVDMSDPRHPKRMASIDLAESEDVAIMDGSYACVTGKGLQVFDYGDPTELIRVGASELSDLDTFGIAIEGNLAYVAAGKDGLLIFKITPQIELAPPVIKNGRLELSWLGAPDIVLQSKTPGSNTDWQDIHDTLGQRDWTVDVNEENKWFRLIKK